MEQILAYFQQYQSVVFLSLVYFAATAYVGLFLILRRASLYGLVLSQVAQVSFLLGLALAALFGDHEHVFAMINRAGAKPGGDWHFLEIDGFVLPITLLLMAPFVISAIRGVRNKETLLVLGLLFFLAAYPLINKAFGGTDVILAKAYFTEILYTPSAMFMHYLPFLVVLLLVFVLFQRRIYLSGFDPVQARLTGISPVIYDSIFYFIAGMVLSIAVRILGAYISMAALVVPGYAALLLFRRMVHVTCATILLGVFLPLTGFVLAFWLDNWPTEPLITIYMVLVGGALIFLRLLIRR
jgi:ABC-type Mn2+/Zn2+ transport system permease subunit